ncbi:MAG: CBS domain-containing protein [Candidatus Thermoplasmatota archaeon]|nr:CBS domain-containing protein [Candidatus Thermoplasmatota archaeon]MBS3789527.1 CBS domain-containing protein [Candidatus Thermoplasmatota archaeon]
MSKAAPKFYDVDMPIRSFVTKRLIGVRSENSVQEAAEKMVEFKTGSLIVIEDDEVVGFLTDGDIKKKVVAEGLKPDMPVKEIMVEDLITADISTDIKEVLELMAEKNIQHVLIEEDDDIVGIVTFRDLIDIERQKLETYISRE